MNESDKWERFKKWCDMVGDYRAKDAARRFENFEAYMKQRESEALQERVNHD